MIAKHPTSGRIILNPQSKFTMDEVGEPYRPFGGEAEAGGTPATIDITMSYRHGHATYRYQYPNTLLAALDIFQLGAAAGNVRSKWVRGEYFNRNVRSVYPWIRL